ncbi:Protein trichome birefringence-like 25 [Capsicum annuum]|nr:Protein trichome birefringence-like 25 [Capsicum annuum]
MVSNNVNKKQFSVVFVKFAVCFLLMGLAYRLFYSSFMQFPPVEVSDKGFVPEKTLQPPLESVNRTVDVTERSPQNGKCDLYIGDWVPDPTGPFYTNNTCYSIEAHQNCMRNGRLDTGYLYWRWKPRNCELPKFNPKRFLDMMRHKSVAFIGDSIMRNHVQSLLCILSQLLKWTKSFKTEGHLLVPSVRILLPSMTDLRFPAFVLFKVILQMMEVQILLADKTAIVMAYSLSLNYFLTSITALSAALTQFGSELDVANQTLLPSTAMSPVLPCRELELGDQKHNYKRVAAQTSSIINLSLPWEISKPSHIGYWPSLSLSAVVWSPFLVKADIFEDNNGVSTDIVQLHLDELDVWTRQFDNFDYVVIAGGKWYLKTAVYCENNTIVGCHNCAGKNITEVGFEYAYRKALNSTLKYITRSKHKAYALFRTTTPDHFENGEWNTGGYCNRTGPFKEGDIDIRDIDEIMRKIELDEFERALRISSEVGMTVKLFDTTFLSLLRPDGHPGAYRQFQPFAEGNRRTEVQNDCLHWCLPGPIDSWNDLMMETLVPLMERSLAIGVDFHGEWIEKSNRYVWHWKEGEMLETIAMAVQSDVSYDDFVNLIISYCGMNYQPEELITSYMHGSFENQRVLPFKIIDQVRLRTYLSDSARPVLRVYVIEKSRENENQNVEEEQQEDIFDDKLDDLDMNIPDDDQTHMPIIASNTVCSSSISTQSDIHQDDETIFYKGIIGCYGHLLEDIYGHENCQGLRGTYEHGYAVLDAYRYMLESTNLENEPPVATDDASVAAAGRCIATYGSSVGINQTSLASDLIYSNSCSVCFNKWEEPKNPSFYRSVPLIIMVLLDVVGGVGGLGVVVGGLGVVFDVLGICIGGIGVGVGVGVGVGGGLGILVVDIGGLGVGIGGIDGGVGIVGNGGGVCSDVGISGSLGIGGIDGLGGDGGGVDGGVGIGGIGVGVGSGFMAWAFEVIPLLRKQVKDYLNEISHSRILRWLAAKSNTGIKDVDLFNPLVDAVILLSSKVLLIIADPMVELIKNELARAKSIRRAVRQGQPNIEALYNQSATTNPCAASGSFAGGVVHVGGSYAAAANYDDEHVDAQEKINMFEITPYTSPFHPYIGPSHPYSVPS